MSKQLWVDLIKKEKFVWYVRQVSIALKNMLDRYLVPWEIPLTGIHCLEKYVCNQLGSKLQQVNVTWQLHELFNRRMLRSSALSQQNLNWVPTIYILLVPLHALSSGVGSSCHHDLRQIWRCDAMRSANLTTATAPVSMTDSPWYRQWQRGAVSVMSSLNILIYRQFALIHQPHLSDLRP